MERHIKTIIKVVLLIMVAAWVISKIPFNKNIDQQISANIYKDGTIIGQTTVSMIGEKSRYIFRPDGFIGEFRIPYVEKTDIDELQTYISWNGEYNLQSISHYYKGKFTTADKRGLANYLLINKDMTNFSIMLTDNTMIATSDELYELYTNHISYLGDGKISVKNVNLISEIE